MSLGVKNYINFHGNVKNVKEHLSESNIYLHTATYEPFGLVILEAMAAGLPVITLNGKGNKDFIEQGVNGFIHANQDVELFANNIIELFTKRSFIIKYQKWTRNIKEI